MSNDDLSFDANESVTQFSTEHGRPLRQPRPEAQTAAPLPQATAPTRQNPQARAIVTEGTASSKPPNLNPTRNNAAIGNSAVHTPVSKTVDNFEDVKLPDTGSRVTRLPLVSRTGPRDIGPAYEDIWLPSEFVSYTWKDLQIRRLNIEELRAMIRARTSGNLRHLIRAIDSTLSRPITDLTQGDFWYIMYWHRLNSYKKSPFIIEWVCDADEHIAKVAGVDLEGKALPEGTPILSASTLRNVFTINKSNLDTIVISKEAYEKLANQIFTEYGVRVHPQTVVDFISAVDEDEELEHSRKLSREKRDIAAKKGEVDAYFVEAENSELVGDNEDRSFIYRYAALIDDAQGQTLNERAGWLNKQEPDLLIDLEDFLKVSDHGVNESWTVVCKECGAPKIVKQSLDALTFLPSLHRGGLT